MIILKPTLNRTDTTNAEQSEVGAAQVVFYQNVDPRRRAEILDSELIREDHTKISNLPDQFIYGKFRQEYY
jgi:hypothetical protein